MNQALKYPLNIQLFAEGEEGKPPVDDGANKKDDVTPPDGEVKKFTQKEVDEMIAKRLARKSKEAEPKTPEKPDGKPLKDGEGEETPDTNQGDDKLIEADIKLQLANQRLVSASAMAEALKLNIIPEHISDVIELAKLTGEEVNADGTINVAEIAKKLDVVVKRLPMFVKAKEDANNGFRIGGENGKSAPTNGWNSKQPTQKKPWNKFQ